MSINVLIIDDQVQILNSFKAHFRTFFNVFTLSTTKDALSVIAENDIHVVLCDYNMPDKNGVLFFSELLITHPHISRVLITGYDEVSIAIEAMNIGCVYRFAKKPWDLDALKIIIEQSHEYYRLKLDNAKLVDRLLQNDRLISLLEQQQNKA